MATAREYRRTSPVIVDIQRTIRRMSRSPEQLKGLWACPGELSTGLPAQLVLTIQRSLPGYSERRLRHGATRRAAQCRVVLARETRIAPCVPV